VLALIVPAIFLVGILAAIAIPSYVDYQRRAQAVESQ
jgi:Tfp pilus assembly protein PilE